MYKQRKMRLLAALGLVALGLGWLPATPTQAVPTNGPIRAALPAPEAAAQARNYSSFGHYFSETSQAASGAFWYYWNEHGGLAQQGYPISEERIEVSDTNGKEYLVQYYERAVFEYHPEVKDRVLLSLLGNFEYKRKYPNGAPNQKANTSAGSVLFRETGKRVGGGFLEYWRKNGGLAQQGFPISDEFSEVSPVDGKTYTVQYFERAVFEYHPETPRATVQLSLLGRFVYERKHQANLANLPSDLDGDTILDSDDACPKVAENSNKVFDNDGCPDTMVTLLTFVAEDLNAFWEEEFDINVGEPYVGPVDFIAYFDEIETACGPAELYNAFYCEPSNGIYYHWDLLEEQLNEIGDFAPVTIIAHEWGHLVQGNLGLLDGSFYTVQTELQADCYAGAWAQHAENQGYLDEGDLDEALESLFSVGDEEDFPWFEPGAHGLPEERELAFKVGYRLGTIKCQQYTP